MLCREFDVRMQKLLDERRSPELDSALLSHAERCSSCQSQLSTLTRLLDSLDLLEPPELPSDFAQKVVAAVDDSAVRTSTTQPHATTWTLVAVAVAATLLLAAVPLSWLATGRRPTVAQPSPQSDLRNANEKAELAQRTPPSRSTTNDGWMVTSATILELYPEEARQRHRQQVHKIADDLRPIATPFSAAVTAIRRSIPLSKSATKGEPRASVERPLRTGNLS